MRLYRVILPVTDIERAARFYSSVLGLQGERVSPGRHYFASPADGGAILACYSPREDGDTAEFGEAWKGMTESEAMPWGETLFYATDPFGNPISFVEAGTEFEGDGERGR